MQVALALLATPPPTNNTYCMACEIAVKEVIKNGCEWAKDGCTSLPAPANQLCEWAVTAGLCPYLANFSSPVKACTEVGLCGTSCECGVCRKEGSGEHGRCLGAPHSCGHVAPDPYSAIKGIRGVARDGRVESARALEGANFCVDGHCGDDGSLGCCLTCF